MISPDLSLAAMMLIVLLEAVLLAFLYGIGNFYEAKFRQRTYSRVFLATAVLLVLLLAVAALGFYTYEAVTLANIATLAVLALFGLRLFRMMTGVAR